MKAGTLHRRLPKTYELQHACSVRTREQVDDGLDVVLREGRQDVVDALEHGLVVHACRSESTAFERPAAGLLTRENNGQDLANTCGVPGEVRCIDGLQWGVATKRARNSVACGEAAYAPGDVSTAATSMPSPPLKKRMMFMPAALASENRCAVKLGR